MTDHATPNLPSRNFIATERFYAKLGFSCQYCAGHWLILRSGAVQLEFFPWPDLEPEKNYHSCCIRLNDLDAMIEKCGAAGLPTSSDAIPRLVPPQHDVSGLTIAYLIDPDGSLLRLVQNPPAKAG